MAWGAIAAAGIGTAGNLIGGNSAAKKTKRLAQQQRAWEVENYKNAHQWEAEDLRKAGMNPALTAQNGTNISGSGAGSLAFPNSLDNLGETINSAVGNWANMQTLDAQKEALRGQANQSNANAAKTIEETNIVAPESKQRIKESNSRIAVNSTQQREINQNIELAGQKTVGQAIANQLNEIELAYQQGDYAKALKYINATTDTIKNAGSAFTSWLAPIGALKAAGNIKELGAALKDFKGTTVGKMITDYAKNNKTKRHASRR